MGGSRKLRAQKGSDEAADQHWTKRNKHAATHSVKRASQAGLNSTRFTHQPVRKQVAGSTFEEAYSLFMASHVQHATGERREILSARDFHAEKMFLKNVWWPLFGNFDGLHPEYEVKDFLDGDRFVDFMYERGSVRVCFEIDGYSTHWKSITRYKFEDHLFRQLALTIDGFILVRFPYTAIDERPRKCQQSIQQLFAKLFAEQCYTARLSPAEKEVMRLFARIGPVVRPVDIRVGLGYSRRHVFTLLKSLVGKKAISASSGSERKIMSYRMNGHAREWLSM